MIWQSKRRTVILVPATDGVYAFRSIADSAQSGEGIWIPLLLQDGREEDLGGALRAKLEQAGFHASNCLLAVPPTWCADQLVMLPSTPVPDETEFFRLQAEIKLPFSSNETALSISRFSLSDGTRGALLIALPLTRLQRWERLLAASGLACRGMFPAVWGHDSQSATPEAVVTHHGQDVFLQVAGVDGMVVWRHLGTSTDTVHCARQLRIALVSLPPGAVAGLAGIRIVAPENMRDTAEQGFGGLRDASYLPGLKVDFSCQPTAQDIAASLAAEASASRLATFQDWSNEPTRSVGQRSRVVIAVVAVLLALLVLGAGLLVKQAFRLGRLQDEQARLAPTVRHVENLRQTIRDLRPWFDTRPRTLDVLRAITEAFPDRGSVWVTQLSVVDGHEVKLMGLAANTDAWLTMQEQLRQSSRIAQLRVSQARSTNGNGELVFALSFSLTDKGGQP
ncbi:MAG: hypothetical protein KAI66_22770 [Lentisphaeria bacterium]|nr:hypothetical protein [Lentisphaeria bacterium]